MKIERKFIIPLIAIVSLLTILSFFRSLDFYFWRDDWDLWSQKYYFWEILKVHNHPGTWVSRALLYHIFGWDRLAWQSLGLFLRIIASLSVSLLMLEISKSKKAAALAGVFFATSIFGMETVTWASVYIIPQVIILNALSFYSWILFVEKRSLKYAVISILLIILAIFADPGRAIFVIPLISLWEVLNWWISSKKEMLHSLAIRVGLFTISLFLFVRFSLFLLFGSRVSLWDNLKYIFSDSQLFSAFFASLGNLLVGWLKSPDGGNYGLFALPIIIILFLAGFILCFFKKSRFGMVLLLLILWIPIMYLPNWLSNKSFASPPTDHYMAVSAVGYLGILALLVSAIRVRWLMYLVVLCFVVFNIKTANEVLISQSSFRSYKIIEPYFDQIEREVPKDEKNSIFMYSGNDNAKYLDLDWSGSTPFGVKRGLTKYEDFPIATSDDKLILKLLCEDNVYRPSMFDWIYQSKRIPISHLHAWELNNGVLKNISIEKREKFRKDAELNNCKLSLYNLNQSGYIITA